MYITYAHKNDDGTWPTDTYSFTSNNVSFDWNKINITVGDLYSGRNLKLIGTIYDVFLCNKILSHSEIVANREYASAVWPLGT